MKTNYINQLQRNIMQDENFHCMPDNEHPKQEQSLLESMKEYFEKTPKKQVQKDWEEILKETEGINSPTINEFLEAQKQFGTQEQSILSIEDAAINYALKEWELKEIPIEETVSRDRFDNSKDDFIVGANEMLPIIKELLETLIKANLYVPPKFYGQGESIDNEDYQTIQTILNKYKNYL
jgi:hypothetical protein